MLSDDELNKFFANYNDRGMKKWQGFYLSDHTIKWAKQDKERNTIIEILPQQSEEEIGQILFNSFSSGLTVIVQENNLDLEGKIPCEIDGNVLGYNEESVMVNETKVKLDNIRNVRTVGDRSV
ncbi:hypothetical protein M5C72_11840 [Companilactobacillus allii]|uniref:DNA-directed RNA polymerase beta subunit n=1 Tax=Companilactobacillus allii TaxID=1847728 RepID=A0A1P8Q0W7_9LACO|nr:hypothetical protein [Companilactobacillus allii]APX71439.1 hypothetical protein BTM29_02205 [Companilactobacillus allii]USQ68520.1 hypothetical protein M5C72_11840 [Companilactobacillus allii]